MTTIVCPECGKDDMIQKVSAIYSGGVSTTSYQQPVAIQTKDGTFYGNVNKTAVNSTTLAKRLAPPPEPQFPDQSCLGCMFFVLLIGGTWAGIYIYSYIFRGYYPLIGFVFMVGVPGTLIYILNKIFIAPRRKVYNENTLPKWKKAQQEWLELYYCSRNDCVFKPNTNETVPPEKMSTLIY